MDDRDASVSTNSQLPLPSSLPAPLLPPTTPVSTLPTRRPPVTIMTVDTDDSTTTTSRMRPSRLQRSGQRIFRNSSTVLAPPLKYSPTPFLPLVQMQVPIAALVAATTARDGPRCKWDAQTLGAPFDGGRGGCGPFAGDAQHISAPGVDALTNTLAAAAVIAQTCGRPPPPHPNGPIHPNSSPTICISPDDHPPREFPAQTNFGEVMHLLAYTCACALPSLDQTANFLRDTVWPVLQDSEGNTVADPDERMDLLGRMPADQLIFLSAVALMGHLEPTFSPFFDPAVVDYVGGLG
ncbi:hypothetical protein R3P38DRAFT_3242765 [Favolaschia claudopus]|uniref:Uncharacterized protein n=1 Tax=Favolaschia claudopus TaxID=2862362 RepID=A0AAV9Z4S9_9AGAR